MKKRLAVILAVAMVFGITSCTSAPEGTDAPEQTTEASSAETPATPETTEAASVQPSTGMANPWTEADSAASAAEGAGVGFFAVPSDGTDTGAGEIQWICYEYMDGIAEAIGYIGTAEITVRKGAGTAEEDISGDYTDYAYEWQLEANGWLVNCCGNENGSAMLITWVTDSNAYSIMIRGQGDIHDTYGIDEYAVDTLVSGIQ